jgi:hypothetical protein
MLTRKDVYSLKYNNKFVRQADGWVYGYYENDVMFIASGPKSGIDVTTGMTPEHAAKFRETGEVVLEKVAPAFLEVA